MNDTEIRRALSEQLLAACPEMQPAAAMKVLDEAVRRVKEGKCVAFKRHAAKVVVMIATLPPPQGSKSNFCEGRAQNG